MITLKLHEVALRSIEVFSAEIAVKQAKLALNEAYEEYRIRVLGWDGEARYQRPHIEAGSKQWGEMLEFAKHQYEELREARRVLKNAKRRLNTSIRSAIGG